MESPSYFDVRRYRQEVPDSFLAYPLISERDALIARRLSARQRILEIGAGDRPLLPLLTQFQGVYRTMDVDRSTHFDYYSIEEINESFDAVLMREVVEHLPRPLFYSYLQRISEILVGGGILVLTTPNTWSPGWMLSDYTHVSAWPLRDMYGILRCYGFKPVEIYRIIWPSRWLWLKRTYWAIHSRFYPIDFAGSYLAIGTKPAR
jgi:SAM-dependent methyltransferase